MTFAPLPVYLLVDFGHHLPGIFPGLFTLKGSGKNVPTQNVYLIKSVTLLNDSS
jgi:hypothetical protein